MTTFNRLINRGPKAVALAAKRLLQRHLLKCVGIRYVQLPIFGYRMYLDVLDPGISRALILYQERELETKKILEELIRPGMKIFDIGTNIGYYINMFLWLADCYPIGIEPVVENCRLARLNLTINGYPTVNVIQAAVSNIVGHKQFSISEHSNLGTFHPVNRGKDISVNITTLNVLASLYGKPDLIRMDVEGHEVEILSTLNKDLMPIVVFETHHDRYTSEHDMAAVLRHLFEIGYYVSTIASANPARTRDIRKLGYQPEDRIRTDATYRTLFRNIRNDDAIDLICGTGGARAVVLKPRS